MDTSSTPTRWSPRLALQFLAPTLAALLGVLAVAAPYLWTHLERRQVDAIASRLAGETRLLGEAIPWDEGAPLEDTCTRLAGDLGLRITVLDGDGRMLCDSDRVVGASSDVADVPEVRAALAAGAGQAVRADGQGRRARRCMPPSASRGAG